MNYTGPTIVIDNGSYTTKAGFASEELPQMVFSSVYGQAPDTNGEIIIGDDQLLSNPSVEVMTLLDDGLIYNFDGVTRNWSHVYQHLDNGAEVNSNEYPLMLTEEPWNTLKNKVTATQLAFETFEVPLFSLVKTPLAQLYQTGKSSGLVIDIGAATTSVTPILDGIIQSKASFHTKYGGDFLNLHIAHYFKGQIADMNQLIPKAFQSSPSSMQNYYITRNIIHDFKVSNTPDYYQLASKNHINVNGFSYIDNLFTPSHHSLPGVEIPMPVLEKPETQGLLDLVFSSLKALESTCMPAINGDNNTPNRFARFNEILKSILSNVLITGGTSLTPGLSELLILEMRKISPNYFSSYGFNQYYIQPVINHQSGDINEIWEKLFGGWKGASSLATMLNDTNDDSNGTNIALENWFITKADYQEQGEDLIAEKFK